MDRVRLGAVAALMMVAAGCEGGRDRSGPPTDAGTPAPRIAPSSIIRPDVVESPIADLPPAPLTATIGFPEGGSALDEAARAKLAEVLKSTQLAEGWPVTVRGHSDSVGHDGDNLVVSRLRAEAVADYLIEQGVADDRIAVIALGEQNPVAPNAKPDGTPDEDGRSRNRRVEISIDPPHAEPAETAPDDDEAENPTGGQP